MQELDSVEAMQAALAADPAVLVFFDAPSCAVGTAVEPKLRELIGRDFPRFKLYGVDTSRAPALAAQYGVTATPTVAVFFEGHEHLRRSRSFSLGELREEIERPYRLLFE